MAPLCSSLLFVGCGSTSSMDRDTARTDYLKKVITEAHYEINSNWAFPLMTQGLSSIANSGLFMPGSNASRIDLIGNPNYLKVIGDSVSVALPYFGERQMGGGGYADSDTGITFDGIPEDYTVQWDKKKNRYQIKMQIRQRTETLQFIISVFPSLKADINLNSTHRTSIGYRGDIKVISEK